MPSTPITITTRQVSAEISFLDIHGDITAEAETALMEAYTAISPGTRVIILNFGGLAYMNSIGIGLIVTFLIRTNRQKQRLLAYGLNEHYRHIFSLTRLDEAIGIYSTEAEALIAAARLY